MENCQKYSFQTPKTPSWDVEIHIFFCGVARVSKPHGWNVFLVTSHRKKLVGLNQVLPTILDFTAQRPDDTDDQMINLNIVDPWNWYIIGYFQNISGPQEGRVLFITSKINHTRPLGSVVKRDACKLF